MISIKILVFNPFAENTYILYDDTGECLIIDPGCYTEEEEENLKNVITNEGLTPVGLLNTHCHIDHVLGNAFVKNTYNLPLQILKDEEQTLEAVPSYAANYGFPNYQHLKAELFLAPNQLISFGNSSVLTLFVPGHSKGHVAFVNRTEKICIGGDVLFDGSIGRTDLPGGDFEVLLNSIREELFSLEDDTVVYPGHGSTTTIGQEKETNPFCALSK